MDETQTEMVMFPTCVYTADKPEFLESVKLVSNEYLKQTKSGTQLNSLYPVYQTSSFHQDNRIQDFSQYVADYTWNILNDQGYRMDDYLTTFSEMWLHEHHRNSVMEQHVHAYGAQMTGFYFIQCPSDDCKVVFHDPRPGKVQINLPERDPMKASQGSPMINIPVKEGLLVLTNPWLPHSFSRHESDTPLQFVHVNLHCVLRPTQEIPVEVI